MSIKCQKQYQITISAPLIPKELYFRMDAASAPWADSFGNAALVPGSFDPPSNTTNGVGTLATSTSGIISNGIVFPDGRHLSPSHYVNLETWVKTLAPVPYPANNGLSFSFWYNAIGGSFGNQNIEEFVVTVSGTDGLGNIIWSIAFEVFFPYSGSVSTIPPSSVGFIEASVSGQSGVVTGPVTSLGAWHFIAVTYTQSSRSISLYLDGVLVGSAVTTFVASVTSFTSYQALSLTDWGFGDSAGPQLNISFDEFGAWLDHVLSPAEITTLWNGGAGSRPAGG
jgi:hypothetical protein